MSKTLSSAISRQLNVAIKMHQCADWPVFCVCCSIANNLTNSVACFIFIRGGTHRCNDSLDSTALSMLALPEVMTAVCSLASSTPQAIFYALKSETIQDQSCAITHTQGNRLISSIYSNDSVLATKMDTLGDEMVLTARPCLLYTSPSPRDT